MSFRPTREQLEMNKIFQLPKPKQCGNCEFWDRQPKSDYATNTGECKHPMPSCVNSWHRRMLRYEGRTCPTYKEQKDVG